MRRVGIMLLMVIGGTAVVEARMYQWTNPATGVTQLSGTPPAWYRSRRAGPRVIVFENGTKIDDSAIEVPEAQRIALRALAFGVDPETVEPLGPDTPPASAVPAASAAPAGPAARAAGVPAEPATGESAEATVARLKRVLEDWDRQRAAAARAIVDDALPEEQGDATGSVPVPR